MSSLHTGEQRIHFINRIDNTNVGDWNCCPLIYFYDFFKDYNLMRHDINFIEWEQISRDDIVILGASGMLYVTPCFNSNINKLLDKCNTVIAWSVGFNSHNEQWDNGSEFEAIDVSRFAMIAIRDYNHPSGLAWLPCPMALAPDLRKQRAIQRKIGVIEHKSLPIHNLPYDKISNACNLNEVSEFIASSEIIVTNSYHMTYLAHLMGKRAVVFNKFSTKFDWFKYKPEFVEWENDGSGVEQIETAAEKARAYPGALDEAVALNQKFFSKVKQVVESKIENKDNSYQQVYQLTRPHIHHLQGDIKRMRELNTRVQRAHDRISEFHAHVYPHIEDCFQKADSRISALDSSVKTAHDRISEFHGHVYPLIESRRQEANKRIQELEASQNSQIKQFMEQSRQDLHQYTDQLADARQRIDHANRRITEFHAHVYPYIKESYQEVNRRVDELQVLWDMVDDTRGRIGELQEAQESMNHKLEQIDARIDELWDATFFTRAKMLLRRILNKLRPNKD